MICFQICSSKTEKVNKVLVNICPRCNVSSNLPWTDKVTGRWLSEFRSTLSPTNGLNLQYSCVVIIAFSYRPKGVLREREIWRPRWIRKCKTSCKTNHRNTFCVQPGIIMLNSKSIALQRNVNTTGGRMWSSYCCAVNVREMTVSGFRLSKKIIFQTLKFYSRLKRRGVG